MTDLYIGFGFVFVTGILALLFFIYGIQLSRGRLLNTIAGNHYRPKEEYETPNQKVLGKKTGRALFSASVLSLLLMLALIFDLIEIHFLYELFLTLALVSIIPLLSFVVLTLVWSYKHMK